MALTPMRPRTPDLARWTALLTALTLAACGAPLSFPDGDAAETDATHDVTTHDSRTDTPTPLDGATDAMADAPPDVHCTAPSVDCGGTCVNLQTSEQHCGRCGNACVTGATCLAGECSLDPTCPPVHYPSAVIQSVPDAAMTALYDSIASGSCFPSPHCFLDLNHLVDPSTGATLDVHVMLSPHFELNEFVATELAGGYTHFALVAPELVSRLESLRAAEGGNPLGIASGFRSPQHQTATCQSICPGGASCCPSASHPCGCRSEHEWGRAADLSIPSTSYTAYGADAHSVGFPDCLLEVGSFHVDVSPCPLGCPYNF
jgi:predicted small lipoprotein YifL